MPPIQETTDNQALRELRDNIKKLNQSTFLNNIVMTVLTVVLVILTAILVYKG